MSTILDLACAMELVSAPSPAPTSEISAVEALLNLNSCVGTNSSCAAPKKSRFVTALYDHDAEADDELTFKVGDTVEVLETGDGGWWSGSWTLQHDV